jgi:four helix bundle suffix protein
MHKVKYLLTYRYAEIIHDLTIVFTKKYILGDLSNLSSLSIGRKPDYRQADQMNQAARSGKQNIVEGVSQGLTSDKGVIKLLGVANASFEELLTDYEDFLRQNKLQIFTKDEKQIAEFRELAYKISNLSNLSSLGEFIDKPKLIGNPQDDANYLLTLCHLETYLLSRQIKAAEEKFIKTGGYNENLYNKRRDYRKY